MKTKKNLLLLLMLLVLPFTLQAETFNVKKYGARGNGKKMDSPAIQKAIDACHKAGGGTVRIDGSQIYFQGTVTQKIQCFHAALYLRGQCLRGNGQAVRNG